MKTKLEIGQAYRLKRNNGKIYVLKKVDSEGYHFMDQDLKTWRHQTIEANPDHFLKVEGLISEDAPQSINNKTQLTREEEIKFRDECAKVALQAILGNSEIQKGIMKDKANLKKSLEKAGIDLSATTDINIVGDDVFVRQWHAMTAYQFADAMLEEKKKRDEKLS